MIKRYIANKDNTITNAYRENLIARGTGSNTGLSDILEVFSIYGQISGSDGHSQELSRVLIQFPIEDMIADRANTILPSSGSVSHYLKLTNARHISTAPTSMKVNILPVSQSWEEGIGKDLESYYDITKDGTGSNWINARAGQTWTNVGGDYDESDASVVYTYTFSEVEEDLEQDISELVEQWMSETRTNYGIGIHLTSSQEAYFSSSLGSNSGSVIHNINGAQESYYTKKFFSRGSEHFYRRPYIESRWDSSVQDDRGQVYFSSSLANAEDNLNTLYLYNVVRGRLRDIPTVGQGAIWVSLYSSSFDSQDNQIPSSLVVNNPIGGGVVANLDTNITGGWISTGIYTASFAITSSSTLSEVVHDVWHLNGTEFFTGSFEPKSVATIQYSPEEKYETSILNLRDVYSPQEIARFRLFTRKRGWCPNIYSVATSTPEIDYVVSGAYEIYRLSDDKKIIPFGTGSDLHTKQSYDVSGNYFDLDMSLFEPDFGYGIRFAYYNDVNSTWQRQQNEFKFRVEE